MFTYKASVSCLVLTLLLLPFAGHATTLSGIVTDENGSPLAGVNVLVVNTTRGGATDLWGSFMIPAVSAGEVTIRASLIGYTTVDTTITVNESETSSLQLALAVDAVSMEVVVLVAERESSTVSLAEPVRTEVISGDALRTSSTDGGVRTALAGTSGLNTRPCALCGAAGIGMQGLDPSYTEVSVDGMPILSGLGAVYGLDAIAVADLARVEVQKGAVDSEASSGAMAGRVNLVTRKPGESSGSFQLSGAGTLRNSAALSVSGSALGIPARISGTWASEPERLDRNGDQITDAPQYDRLNLQATVWKNFGNSELRFGGRVMRESRFAGETMWTEADKGSATIYGRDINTNRTDVSGRFLVDSPIGRWALESALVNHQQNSWYGTTQFNAEQLLSINKLTLNHDWSEAQTSRIQAQYRYEDYRDNLTIGNTDRLDRVPEMAIQHTWQMSPFFRLVAGSRVSHYVGGDDVLLPRASLMYQPDDHWTMLLSGGTGYRPVTIFSLDKAVHAGFDNVSVPENLKPERSRNVTAAVQYRRVEFFSTTQVDLATFYTEFDNKVILAFADHSNGTVYTNALDAYARGVEAQVTHRWNSGWSVSLGGNFADVQYLDDSGWHLAQLQNIYTANGSIIKDWTVPGITFELKMSHYGPQPLPAGRSRDESPSYTIFDLGLSRKVGPWTLATSIENLTDYVQPDDPLMVDPLTGTREMDSAMIYGPLLGRVFSVSLIRTWGM